jgi:two-component system sensor histidine kinase/response regulator
MLLDAATPPQGALTLARKIQASPAVARTRLVLIGSAHGQSDWPDDFARLIDARVSKPVRQVELYGCLADATTGAPVPGGVAEPAEPLGIRVLLAEDNPVNQEVTCEILERLGCDVHLVKSGDEALTALDQKRFDIVLMDCQMPVRDGYQTVAELRRRERETRVSRRVAVVALTANAMPGDRDRCLAAGMDDYLAKPFTSARLHTVLRRWAPVKAVQPQPVLEKAALDKAALEGVLSGDRAERSRVLDRLIALFHQTTREQMAELRTAVVEGNCEHLRSVAHAAKSGGSSVGAIRVAALCERLEQSADVATAEQQRAMLDSLEAEIALAQAALQAELRRYG